MSGPLTTAEGGGGHERRDVSIPAITWAAVGLVVLIAFTFIAMYGLEDFYNVREARLSPPANPLASTYGRTRPPEPRLQEDPIHDLEVLRAREAELLSSYGWIDRQEGTVRIPIERAMEILVSREGASAAGHTGEAAP